MTETDDSDSKSGPHEPSEATQHGPQGDPQTGATERERSDLQALDTHHLHTNIDIDTVLRAYRQDRGQPG